MLSGELRHNLTSYSLPSEKAGERVLTAHTGHIFYNNKLGVGDGVRGLRTIDHTLQWDEKRQGWYFEFHSFQPFIPLYADEWAYFRDVFEQKDQTVGFKPRCQHVEGKLLSSLDGVTEQNCVLYTDAFAEGQDLIYYFTNTTLKKVVRIRDGFKPKIDTSFDFEVKFPDGIKVYRGETETSIAYELDLTRTKEFDTAKQTLIGSANGYTYFRPFLVWDSSERPQQKIVKTEYLSEGILRKTITADYLVGSVGDVFTDTTTSYNSGTGDGGVASDDGITRSFANCRADTTGKYADYTSTTIKDSGNGWGPAVISYAGANLYSIIRGFLPFDTSGLGSGATITGAKLGVTVTFVGDDSTDGYGYLSVVTTTQASTSSLENADYDNQGTTKQHETSEDKDLTGLSGTVEWTLNATGIGNISKTGWTKFGIREGHDLMNQDPGWSTDKVTGFRCYSADNATSKPYLSVTYTPEMIVNIPTLLLMGTG